MFKKWLNWETPADKVESISFIILIIAAIFTIVGIFVGTFVPGFPVLLALIGAFLIVVGIVFYIVSEFVRIFVKETKEE